MLGQTWKQWIFLILNTDICVLSDEFVTIKGAAKLKLCSEYGPCVVIPESVLSMDCIQLSKPSLNLQMIFHLF